MLITRKQLANLKLSFDSGSVDIYVDNGEGNEPTSLIYWISDEWVEDNEVILSVFNAIQLYHTNKVQLLELTGYDVEKETSNIDEDLLLKFGVIVSNDEVGKLEYQRIDCVKEFADNKNLDFVPPQLKSDEDAKLIAKYFDNIEVDRILTINEYISHHKIDLNKLKEFIKDCEDDIENLTTDEELLHYAQMYSNDEFDYSMSDYPLEEFEHIIEHINKSVALVYINDYIRICEL